MTASSEFHMDITPSVPNAACVNGGELVPDKALQCWKTTNPKGYRAAFQKQGGTYSPDAGDENGGRPAMGSMPSFRSFTNQLSTASYRPNARPRHMEAVSNRQERTEPSGHRRC